MDVWEIRATAEALGAEEDLRRARHSLWRAQAVRAAREAEMDVALRYVGLHPRYREIRGRIEREMRAAFEAAFDSACREAGINDPWRYR